MKNVTIIITYIESRIQYLNRLLEYYRDIPCKIITIGPHSDLIVECGTRVKKLFVDPNEALNKKLMLTERHVTTPYLIWCAEDDFALVDAIDESQRFMEDHPEVVIVEGFSGRFSEKRAQLVYSSYFIRSFHIRVSENNNYYIEDFQSRVKHFSRAFSGMPTHALCRKDVFYRIIDLMNKTIDLFAEAPTYGDKIFCLYALCHGCIAMKEMASYLRSDCERTLKETNRLFKNILSDDEIINFVSVKVAELANISIDESREICLDYFNNILNYNIPIKRKGINRFLNRVARRLNPKIESLNVFLKNKKYPIYQKKNRTEIQRIMRLVKMSNQ